MKKEIATKERTIFPNIERLEGTLKAVLSDLSHFNQGLWVTPPNSPKHPEPCGCFAWYAVNLYGTPEQKKKFTWDGYHDWVGTDILSLNVGETRTLFWGGNTPKDIQANIVRYKSLIKKALVEK